MREQKINQALEIMVFLQKPLKRVYLDKRNKITKEMVEEFLSFAKNGESPEKCLLIDEFWKDQGNY